MHNSVLQRQSRITSYRDFIASGTDLNANKGELSLTAGGTEILNKVRLD